MTNALPGGDEADAAPRSARPSAEDWRASLTPKNARQRRVLIRRTFGPRLRVIVLTSVISMVAAMLEAATLVLIVQVGASLANADTDGSLGVLSSVLDGRTDTQLALAAFAFVVLSFALNMVATAIRTRTTAAWTREARTDLLAQFLQADWSFQSRDRAGRLQTVSTYIDSSAFVLEAVANASKAFLAFVVFLLASVVVNTLALLGIGFLGAVLYLVFRPIGRISRREARHLAETTVVYNETLGELSGLSRDIYTYAAGPEVARRTQDDVNTLARLAGRLGFLRGVVAPLYQSAALALLVIALAVASRQTSFDVASIGAVALLALRSMSYGQQFQTAHHQYAQTTPVLELLGDTLDELAAHQVTFGDAHLEPVERIELVDVGFRYRDSGATALDHVDLTISRGEIVGVAGPSGAGKSTLAQILLRLQRPGQGAYLVNGQPAWDYTAASWADQVALVPQDGHLMHASITENIRFFRDRIDQEAVEQAADRAELRKAIGELDHGFDELVGPAARNLSGGQVQRLAIARALAGDPSLLILDEPTSALDGPTEEAIHNALRSLQGRCAVIIIAHRLSTLAICDRVVVFDSGAIEAQGPIAEARRVSAFLERSFRYGALAEA